MDFDVYFISKQVDNNLTSVWDGERLIHPSLRSPKYYSKREISDMYRLMSTLQATEMNGGDGGMITLNQASFTYSGNIAPVPAPALPLDEDTSFAPTSGTAAPVTPNAAPVTPTAAPVTPNAAPVTPTAAPVTPTAAPVTPTAVPITPTAVPITPTAT